MKTILRILVLFLAAPHCLAFSAQFTQPDLSRPGLNVALGKRYTLDPSPNYALCSDPGDAVQLTDGVYTRGHFWTQKGTVGWQGTRQVLISIDLGREEPICGVSYDTAAGTAGVAWPSEILVLVSDDGQGWYPVGDLVRLSDRRRRPPTHGYHRYRYWTGKLRTYGRYLGLVVFPKGSYAFCDEIEVYRGPHDWLRTKRRGRPLHGLANAEGQVLLRRDISRDIRQVSVQLGKAGLAARLQAALKGRLHQAEADLDDLPVVSAPGFVARLPLARAQAEAFQVQAALWRAAGQPLLQVWPAVRWAPLKPDDVAPAHVGSPKLDLVLLRGEVRSAALNLTCAAKSTLAVKFHVAGMPAAPRPPWLHLRRAEWTVSRDIGYVASALPEATSVAGGWTVPVPSGMTIQVWFTIDAGKLAPGSYAGQVVIAVPGAADHSVPLRVRVSRVAMPKRLSLALGGWDYTDGPGRGVTSNNLDKVVAFLRHYGVDSPWASGAVMPFGQYDPDGSMTKQPDTTRMEAWLNRWPGARYYCVFNAFTQTVPDNFVARRRVGAWIDFWVEFLQRRGIHPSQLVLLLVDETRTAEQDRRIVSYARIIHRHQPQVRVFNDPIWRDPAKVSPQVLELSGILSPNRIRWMAQRKAYEAVYLPQRQAGRKLAFYSCSGPARALDPYSYYRLQAWDCFRYGAVMESFWAFCDTGGGSSWNEYCAPGRVYAPEFLGPGGCVTSKNMEAIRAGRYDYEILTRLRRRAEAARRAHRDSELVRRAEALLTGGVEKVLGAPGEDSIQWLTQKDRSRADTIRREAIELLEQLR